MQPVLLDACSHKLGVGEGRGLFCDLECCLRSLSALPILFPIPHPRVSALGLAFLLVSHLVRHLCGHHGGHLVLPRVMPLSVPIC